MNWLRQARDANRLLLILSELLPSFYEATTTRPRSLRRINAKVLKKIKEHNMYSAPASS
jgi:hypothetical protein